MIPLQALSGVFVVHSPRQVEAALPANMPFITIDAPVMGVGQRGGKPTCPAAGLGATFPAAVTVSTIGSPSFALKSAQAVGGHVGNALAVTVTSRLALTISRARTRLDGVRWVFAPPSQPRCDSCSMYQPKTLAASAETSYVSVA